MDVRYILLIEIKRNSFTTAIEMIIQLQHQNSDCLPVPPYTVYNIGNNQPENLLDFVQILQEELVRAGVLPADYEFEAHKELVPMQAGDVPITFADTKAPPREGLREVANGRRLVWD